MTSLRRDRTLILLCTFEVVPPCSLLSFFRVIESSYDVSKGEKREFSFVRIGVNVKRNDNGGPPAAVIVIRYGQTVHR